MKILPLSPILKALGLCAAFATLSVLLPGCGGGGTSPSVPIPTLAPATGALRVACVGDSITVGNHTSNSSTDSYPALLGSWLGAQHEVQNFGVGGATALNRGVRPYQQTPAYAQALTFKPNILVVALGTNDTKFNLDSATRDQFQSDYKTLIAAFKAANAKVKIYACLPTPFYGASSGGNGKLDRQVMPLIRTIAQEKGLQVIDFNTLLSNHAEFFKDGIHPDSAGTRLMAAEVYRALTGKQAPK